MKVPMNDDQKSTYVAWLNDAHALEENLDKMLADQIEAAADRPMLRTKLEEHREETKRHAELVRTCLARHDETPSRSKDVLGKLTAAVNSVTVSMAEDSTVKQVHGSYAAEHVEIATYTLLRAAASVLGDTETATVCDAILEDERAMAAFLIDILPDVTEAHLDELA